MGSLHADGGDVDDGTGAARTHTRQDSFDHCDRAVEVGVEKSSYVSVLAFSMAAQ
jgi:hypothetical protein